MIEKIKQSFKEFKQSFKAGMLAGMLKIDIETAESIIREKEEKEGRQDG